MLALIEAGMEQEVGESGVYLYKLLFTSTRRMK
jgi:hypothetical protein